MRARYVKQIGIRGKLRIYWDEVSCKELVKCDECDVGHPSVEYLNTCPNSYGKGNPGVHNAYALLGDKIGETEFGSFGKVEDYEAGRWPTACDSCGAAVPAGEPDPVVVGAKGVRLVRQVFTSRLYDSPSGAPEPGDVYKIEYHGSRECPYWDNCDGVHVWAILPNGHTWDIDARASNCTMPQERTHRCWIKTGTPEDGTLHVDKNGFTCAAGAGSIAVPGYHGFLHGFNWTDC